jgi:hypothetical protein
LHSPSPGEHELKIAHAAVFGCDDGRFGGGPAQGFCDFIALHGPFAPETLNDLVRREPAVGAGQILGHRAIRARSLEDLHLGLGASVDRVFHEKDQALAFALIRQDIDLAASEADAGTAITT